MKLGGWELLVKKEGREGECWWSHTFHGQSAVQGVEVD